MQTQFLCEAKLKLLACVKKNYNVVLGPSEDQKIPLLCRISTFITAGNPRNVRPQRKYPSPLLIQYSHSNFLLMMW